MSSNAAESGGESDHPSSLDATFVPDGRAGEPEKPMDETEELAKTQPIPSEEVSTAKNKPSGRKSAKKTIQQLGDFKLIRKLGEGGMGTVYLAQQVSLDRPIALKTLSRHLAKKESAVKRFLREARSMAKLQHPNIVQVYAADSQSGIHYAALEFIDGRSMQDWMNSLKRISVGDALHIILICADALKHADDQGMVHRDVKPDNILVTKTGIVKVSDFGLAKAVDDVSVTQSGTGLGTPLYMAPEQARNAKHVDRRADIYALGCTLYYFLTGVHAFDGNSTLEVIQLKEKGQFKNARRLNPEIPEKLDLMIDKMLAKKPAFRYSDCGEIIRDLQGLERANPALSFIDGSVSAPIVAATSVSPTRATMTAGRSTTHGISPGSVPLPSPEPSVAQEKWYVAYTGKDGKPHLKHLTAPQVVKAIQGGKFDSTVKAKRKKGDQMMPLSQYPEFVQDVEKSLIRRRSENEQSRIKELYAEVDRYERKKQLFRWIRRMTESVLGMVMLAVWLAVIAGICIGLFYALPWAGNFIAEYFNLKG